MPRRPLRPLTALLAALALACLVVGGLWWWQSRFEASVMDGTIPGDLAFATLHQLRRWLTTGVAACLGALGGVVGWMAWSVRRDGRWPPGMTTSAPLDPSRRSIAVAGLAAGAIAATLGAVAVALSAWR